MNKSGNAYLTEEEIKNIKQEEARTLQQLQQQQIESIKRAQQQYRAQQYQPPRLPT